MPYKFETDKLLIPRELDRRIKLSTDDKKIIRGLYKTGQYSQRQLAREYNVSRRLITFIIDPEKQEKNVSTRADRKSDYDRGRNTQYMKKYREVKKKLAEEDKLISPKDIK